MKHTKQSINEFVEYVLSYYAKGEMYDIGATREEVLEALAVRLLSSEPNVFGRIYNTIPFEGDSVDREAVRDIMLANRGAA